MSEFATPGPTRRKLPLKNRVVPSGTLMNNKGSIKHTTILMRCSFGIFDAVQLREQQLETKMTRRA